MARSDISAGKAFVELYLKSTLNKGLLAAQERLQSFGSSVMRMGAVISGIGAAASSVFVYPINAAGDLMETISKFGAVFGEQTEGMTKWADDFRGAVGRSKQDVYTGLATFQAFFQGLSFAGDEAAGFSKEMAALAVDFASFHNMQDPEAMQRFISALSGSGEVLSMYGVNIMEAALNQKLLAMGFPTISKGATEAQKVLARMAIIKETMGRQGAVGDAIRTSGSFANQMKSLRATIADTAAVVGDALLPVITPIITVGAKVVRAIAGWIKENPQLVRTVAMVAAGVTAAGLAITAMGATIFSVGAAFGAAAVVIKAVVAGVGLLLSPLGLVTAAVVGVVVAWARFTESGRAAVSSFMRWFGEFAATVKDTFGGIVDALSAGDLALAGQIALAGLSVIWKQAIQGINKLWEDAKWWFLSVWQEATSGLAKLFVTAWAGIQSGWVNLVAGMQAIWAGLDNTLKKSTATWAQMWDEGFTTLQEKMGIIDKDVADAARRSSRGVRDRAKEDAEIEAAKRLDQIEQDRLSKLQSIEEAQKGITAVIEDDRKRARDAIDKKYNDDLAAAQNEVDKARDALRKHLAKAKEAKPGETIAGLSPAEVAKLPEAATAIGKGTPIGSFSAAGLMAGAQGGADKVVDAVKGVKEEIKALRKEAMLRKAFELLPVA